MNRENHYEAAFEAYLRQRGVAFVAVNETHRTLLGQGDIKSVDFIIVSPAESRMVIDVKGRRYPGGTAEHPIKTWQNWSSLEDIDGLIRWSQLLGADYRGVLAFVYQIQAPFVLPDSTPDAFVFRGETYLIRGIEVQAYHRAMRIRSPRWGTVHLPTAAFRELVQPFSDLVPEVRPPMDAACEDDTPWLQADFSHLNITAKLPRDG